MSGWQGTCSGRCSSKPRRRADAHQAQVVAAAATEETQLATPTRDLADVDAAGRDGEGRRVCAVRRSSGRLLLLITKVVGPWLTAAPAAAGAAFRDRALFVVKRTAFG